MIILRYNTRVVYKKQKGGVHDFIISLRSNKIGMSITYQPKKRKRSRTHGFLRRARSVGGRNVLKRRRRKGRKKIGV